MKREGFRGLVTRSSLGMQIMSEFILKNIVSLSFCLLNFNGDQPREFIFFLVLPCLDHYSQTNLKEQVSSNGGNFFLSCS